MKFFLPALVMALTVAAAPQGGAPPVGNDPAGPGPDKGLTVGEAANRCGSKLQVNCCNKGPSDADPKKGQGLLGGILGSIDIFDDCSPINVGGIPGAENFLNNECQAKVACCDRSHSEAKGGLINLALPCLSFGSIF